MRRNFGWVIAGAGILAAAAIAERGGRSYIASSLVAVGLLGAIVVVLAQTPRVRWLLPVVGPIAFATLVAVGGGTERGIRISRSLGDFGFYDRIALLAGVALVSAVLLAAGFDVGRWMARGAAVAGRLLASVLGALAFLVIAVPAWAWTRLLGRNAVRSTPSGWQPVLTVEAPRDLAAGLGPAAAQRRLPSRIAWSIGVVVLLLSLDYGIGWAWDQAFPTGRPSGSGERAASASGALPPDPRVDEPAMAAYPWREQYFDDIRSTSGGCWPFTEARPNDFTSPYLNIRGWERLSYEPEGDRSAMPVVAMLGGSTTWGEGQRDEYTVASWLARLAERDGVPLVIHNYGQRGWTHFQEMILYEQLLALGPVPDISVFYDGANELTTQSLLDVAVPSHTMAYAYAERLTGKTVATEFLQQPATRAPWSAAWEAYQEHSAIDKLAGLLRGEPAGAAPRQDDGAPGDGFTSGQEENEDGLISNYDITDQDGIDAGKVYERGKALTLEISRTYGVEPLLFWQPMAQDVRPQQLARAELTDSTIDISGVLQDHREVFIDAVHTNEEGARMVAEAIWKHLGPAIHRWYREHD